ncbi:retrovirus-related pol polyprotein from transposon TNT 1-94 [Tanacetum coccineum]|uniref:Retrovirus-related pol polyprotein from transposon TNT 1-94 n=1 Tax=Tanacetum coccineum TaxID=301880 RepID=A0ABQ5CS24_9ASTR
MVMVNDSEIIKGNQYKYKSIALKAKMESSDDEVSTSRNEDEEYAVAMRDFKNSSKDEERAFVSGTWSDSGDEDNDPKKDKVCLKACLELDEWIKDSGCSKHMTRNKSLFSTYQAYNGELVRNLPKLKYDEHFCDACKIGKQVHASPKAKNMVSTSSKKIQNQQGFPIVSICTDHGREFDDEAQFRAYWDANGISYNFSAPRTPQSNEAVERLQIKQMQDDIFFNQSKYIKEMLKKFGLEDSKPTKTPMSSESKLTKDDDGESVNSTKYRGMIGTTTSPPPQEPRTNSPPPPQATSPPPPQEPSPLPDSIEPLVEPIIFTTPPTSPHPFMYDLKDLPIRPSNPSPQPTFDTIDQIALQPPRLSFHSDHMEVKPPPPCFPQNQTLQNLDSSLWINGPSALSVYHEHFCECCQRTQVIANELREEMRFILNHILERLLTY